MAKDFKLNQAGIRALLVSEGVEEELKRRGRRVEAVAQALAPKDTGELANSIQLESDRSSGNPQRARAFVVAHARHSAAVALRTGFLARALDAAGGD